MITIWGRESAINVRKVLWCCQEINLPFERIDAGRQYGRLDDADFLALNPNGLIPTLVDKDYVLWESHAIVKYLALEYGADTPLYAGTSKRLASIDRWMDWASGTLWPGSLHALFRAIVRTQEAERDMRAIEVNSADVKKKWGIVDQWLRGKDYIEGRHFSIADIVLGVYAQCWVSLGLNQQVDLPNFQRWYQQLEDREGFQRYATIPPGPG